MSRLKLNCNVQSRKDLSLFGIITDIIPNKDSVKYKVLWDGYDHPVSVLGSHLQELKSEEDILHGKAPI